MSTQKGGTRKAACGIADRGQALGSTFRSFVDSMSELNAIASAAPQ